MDYGPVGGTGGGHFDDSDTLKALQEKGADITKVRIASITVRSGAYIDSIQVDYLGPTSNLPGESITSAPPHGGGGGGEQKFTFAPDEYIVEVRGRYGRYVDSLYLQTNKGQVIGRLGGTGGNPDYDMPNEDEMKAGNEVIAFSGASGTYIDAIGIHTRPHPTGV